MISIITTFYNAEDYVGEAIKSVQDQEYKNWELLLINDGSTDLSKEVALSHKDSRIRYFEQDNQGVSSARNVGLANMKGDFFCFFDADDTLPINSLNSRRLLFNFNSSIKFVDGVVKKMDARLENTLQVWRPEFLGNPFIDLVQLTGKSFFGPSWMIKRDFTKTYKMKESLSHTEDLFFYMELAREGGQYISTTDCILHYRSTPNSAMKNLEGLEAGYRFIESEIRNWNEIGRDDLNIYRFKYRKAMFLAYLRRGKMIKAIKAIF